MRLWGAALLACMAVPAWAEPGTVVVVGGALADDNADVYRAMIDAMPADARDVVIIPAASGIIGRSVPRAAKAFEAHGVEPSRIRVVEVAIVDDPDTKLVDESRWAAGASNPSEVAKLAGAGLIWMLGGDQSRIMAALVASDGSDTPMLAAIRQRLEDGAVIAGTSAGAAVMGEHMIACGSPDVALTAPVSRDLKDCEGRDEDAASVPLALGRGLGLLPGIVFDQHFSERNRLSRLMRAVACIDATSVTGVGVDEDTGFVFELGRETGHVTGRGTITVIDPSDGYRSCERAVMENARFARFPAMKD